MTTNEIYRRAHMAERNNDTVRARWLLQAEHVKQLLDYCCYRPGATVTITVEHADGQKATADLYDNAALVQSLFDALDDFQDEL